MTLKYEHLLGRPFNIETQNCYQLVRDFYRDNYDIELSDYPCPTDWWDHGLDLFRALSSQEGFEIITSHPMEWKPGDVLVMAIRSSVGNHSAVLLDDGMILHHLVGQLSTVTRLGGLFRETLIGVYRHRDVKYKPPAAATTDLLDLLPRHVRRRLQVPDPAGPAEEPSPAGA